MRICLYDTKSICLHTAKPPFGEGELARLASLRNPQRKRESLGALLALHKLTGDTKLTIRRTAEGKPYFDDPMAPVFSLTHAKELSAALLAPPAVGAVGVDLEPLRPYPQAKAIAARFFSEEERELLRKSDHSELTFFLLWTQKEAGAKLYGKSLLEPVPPPPFTRAYRLRYEETEYVLSLCAQEWAEEPQWLICGKEQIHEPIRII